MDHSGQDLDGFGEFASLRESGPERCNTPREVTGSLFAWQASLLREQVKELLQKPSSQYMFFGILFVTSSNREARNGSSVR